MKIIDIKEIPIAEILHKIDVRKLFSFEHTIFIHIVLKSIESLNMHLTSVNVCFYVIERENVV
ncbi:MAG: hypothetical protein ACTSSM_08365 [Promethearchaeota archaeon]